MLIREKDDSADGPTLRVLVADDDPIARDLILTHLQGAQCKCIEAEDGLVAWQAIMSNSFDLAIVDLGMPNLDGFELIRCVRSHPRTKHMPLIVITARDDKQAITESLEAGATSFMTKPINWTTFSSHVGYLLKLSHEAYTARREANRFQATCRVKDAILGNVLGETFANACDILDEVRDILHQSEAGTPASPQHLERISVHTEELQSLVKQACDVARSVSDAITVDEKIVFVSDVLSELDKAVATTAATRNIEIQYQAGPSSHVMRCDPTSFGEALLQLVLNAIAHSPQGSSVTVGCQLLPDGVLAFEVSDEGGGMSPEVLAKALSPLAFKESVPALGRGDFGLGLPLAKAIGEAHGGNLELRSMPKQGTTATLFLPPDRVIVSEGHAA